MNATLAVILAFVILINGWLLMAGIMYGIGRLLLLDQEATGLMHWINHSLMLVLSPGFGGFLATYVTPKLFNKVNADTITIGIIAVTITLATLISLVYLVFFLQEKPGIPDIGKFALFIVQVFTIVIGAKIGKRLHVLINA
ncbi:MAG: hypothetical protein E2O81_01155 [Betaproteobacteria bacterium]|nr:MAG: hypothetical protein E2O81_01155 [Betaproteobacteria bacterium]TDI80022.1 MAG: hypothetical protein E2O80_07540 [Betaproteobacteria bacterium]